MNQMMKQVQKMQQDMAEAQEQLKHEKVEASAGGGMVTVTVSGDLVVKSIDDRPRGDRSRGSRAAAGHGPGRGQRGDAPAQELPRRKMGGLTGGMDLGSLGLPGF